MNANNPQTQTDTTAIMAQPTSSVPAIYPAMAAIMADTVAVAKDRLNKQQGFKYRGVDDIYNALHPIMAKHKVFTLPEVLEEVREEKQTKSGGTLVFTRMRVRYHFVCGIDGSSTSALVSGEGMDSGDKGTNKALSNAHKYLLYQTFLVPTLDVEADAEALEASQAPQTISASEYQAIREDMQHYGLSVEYIERYLKRTLNIDSLRQLPNTMIDALTSKFPAMQQALSEKRKQKESAQSQQQPTEGSSVDQNSAATH